MAQTEPQQERASTVTETAEQETPAINQALIDLLKSWREDGDAEEQRETWEYLKRVLDGDRLSDRKLFS